MVWSAEAAREHRAWRKALGKSVKGGKRGKHVSLFDKGQFVAIDGEGFSEGKAEEFIIGDKQTVYKAVPHFYSLLSASNGLELYVAHGRLSTAECLDFLIDSQAATRNAILVCFGASYDMTHMLHNLDYDQITQLLRGDGRKFSRRYVDVTFGDYDYRLECRPRKQLTVWRWQAGADKYERKKGVWRLTKHDRAMLWDTWGFFQSSFAEAMRAWIPKDPDYQFIATMKGERSVFDRAEIDTIRRYNAAELRCLVAMMEIVRSAVRALGLKITRWDGAGAIASAMYRLHGVKEHMAESPPEVFEASRYAYSGGHIEMYKIGYYKGRVYHYDINSAYPNHFRKLPSLANGRWSHGTGTPSAGFTLVRVAYGYRAGLPFYPLFHREADGTILYPRCGQGWYWYPEFECANRFYQKLGGDYFTVLEWWHLQPFHNESPFSWIEEYYEARKRLIDDAKAAGVEPPGEEKAYKLGYNACYGKTAQQVGARWEDGQIKQPTYFQLEWAGYVTSGCRAQIMDAAMQKPNAIISIATDGIFSTEPLDLPMSKGKVLGEWEGKVHTGLCMVMPGVYWFEDDDKVTHHSRGFDKKEMREFQPVLSAWKRGEDHLDVKLTRMVTMGSALASDAFWHMRGRFVETTRSLQISGDNSKRHPITVNRAKPWLMLTATEPRAQKYGFVFDDDDLMSAPYPIDWLDMTDENDDDSFDVNDDVLAAFLA